jgi:tetratricopeptide (TPR) repeat protein
MLPPSTTMTTKKRTGLLPTLAVVTVAATFLTACGPPGSRDLRQGQKEIKAGEFDAAVATLNDATRALSSASPAVQSTAWNLLGVAYQEAGQLDAASQAYLQAHKFDPNHEAVDYNLGCLRMEQNDFPGAIDYFTTCIALKPREPDGYLKLGAARYHLALEKTGVERARQLESARREFELAEKARPTAEGANAIGMLEMQRRNGGIEAVKIAAADFQTALDRDPQYGPALLNLGILNQQYLNQLPKALQLYLKYLSLQPAPPHVKEVAKLAQELNTVTHITIGADTGERPTTNHSIIMGPKTTAPASQKPAPGAPPTSKAAPTIRAPAETSEIQAANVPAEGPAPPPAQPPTPPPKTATSAAPSNPPAETSPSVNTATSTNQLSAQEPVGPPPGAPPKKTFAQKLNPVHWFSGKSKTSGNDSAISKIKRYQYPATVTPIPGNRAEAERLAAQGAETGKKGHLQEAVRDYQQAAAADPTDFDAALSLGLTAIDAGAYETALEALHRALALEEDSANARYAFAWTLQKRGYYVDAAVELEKLLGAHPDEARGHLLLGNLYAERLGEPKEARDHYAKVLELDPNTPQAPAIRAWILKAP